MMKKLKVALRGWLSANSIAHQPGAGADLPAEAVAQLGRREPAGCLGASGNFGIVAQVCGKVHSGLPVEACLL